MNRTFFLGYTTRDIEIRYGQGDNPMAIGKFSIAIDSGYGDKKKTNFFNCTIFGKQAEAFEKYVPKGTKVLLECEANQNQYTDRNGNKVNTVDFIVKNFEFCEKKSQKTEMQKQTTPPPMPLDADGFMAIPDNVEDEGLPFN